MTQQPLPSVWEQLERIQAQLAFVTATLQRHGLLLERITGKPPRDTDQTSMTADIHRAVGATRVPGGMRDPD